MARPRAVRRRTASLVAVLALVAAACSDDARRADPQPSSSTSAVATPSPSSTPSRTPAPSRTTSPSASPACPATYAAPDPGRPRVQLGVDVADDHRTVTGREIVRWSPDRAVTALVFRLWANAPRPRRGGGSIELTSAKVDGVAVRPALSSGGTLARLPLGRTHAAGELTVELEFRLVLPRGVNERMGTSDGTAWMASAFPLLAWERGRGWATEPATDVFAEATTSEVFTLDRLTVTAPKGDEILATGTGLTTGQFKADAVRDVMVAVGKFRTATVLLDEPGITTGEVPVTVGVAPGLPDDAARLVRLHVDAIRSHARRFGPFPYASLKVAVVPVISGGIEYPGAILLGSKQDDGATLSHEVAHEWFYGLVGNNQGRDPWLDESLATYAEALHRGTAVRYLSRTYAREGRGQVGRPMTYWESRKSIYHRSVYTQGAAGLLRARSRAGAARFDAAIRCYVNANAHRVASPADLVRALAGLPAALEELRAVGALPR